VELREREKGKESDGASVISLTTRCEGRGYKSVENRAREVKGEYSKGLIRPK
jgi:hypothetical protein